MRMEIIGNTRRRLRMRIENEKTSPAIHRGGRRISVSRYLKFSSRRKPESSSTEIRTESTIYKRLLLVLMAASTTMTIAERNIQPSRVSLYRDKPGIQFQFTSLASRGTNRKPTQSARTSAMTADAVAVPVLPSLDTLEE